MRRGAAAGMGACHENRPLLAMGGSVTHRRFTEPARAAASLRELFIRQGAGARMALWALALASLLLAGCASAAVPAVAPLAGRSAAGQTLTVFAAASLAEAFTEIGRGFEAAHPGTRIVFNFAGSQQLAQQLAQGAPADVFASADAHQMAAAVRIGRVCERDSQSFARNRLVVIFPPDNPARLLALADLARPGLRLVIAAPQVPAGQYAFNFLARASKDPGLGPRFGERVLANVVSHEENVRAVLSKVALGEADAGIVYFSDISAARPARIGRLEIPDAWNPVAEYPIAAIADSRRRELAQAFVDFVLSAKGRAVLAQHGFMVE